MRKNFIARAVHDGDLIVGKEVEGTFHGVTRDGDYVTKSSSYERLVVYISCHVTWIDHDASTGQPQPTDVLIGEILTSTNKLLYVARLSARGYTPQCRKHVHIDVGHYQQGFLRKSIMGFITDIHTHKQI